VMCLGGNNSTFMFSPVAVTTEEDYNGFALREALLLHRDGGRPYVIAMKQPNKLGVLDESVPTAGDNTDKGLEFSKNDFVMKNAGSQLHMSDDGDITLTIGRKYFRVQLPTNGKLRVSETSEANETVILAHKFIDQFINSDLYLHLQAQNARISALEGQVAKLTQVLSSGVQVSATTAPVTGTNAAVSGQVTLPPAGLTGFSPPTQVPVPTAGDAHKSGVVELSSKAAGV
jgi:hypothetical protein